jgi:hypothetical protein
VTLYGSSVTSSSTHPFYFPFRDSKNVILNFLFVDHKLYFKAADFGGKILLQRAIGLIPRPGGNQLKLYAYFQTLTKVQSAEIIFFFGALSRFSLFFSIAFHFVIALPILKKICSLFFY